MGADFGRRKPMPPDRRRNALDQAGIEATMPGEKDIRLYDGDGLHLLITPNGARYWRFKYWYEGKPKSVSAGVFPTVSLAQARAKRDEYRTLLAQCVNPSDIKKAERALERDEEARRLHGMRFFIESDGTLAIRLGRREITLTPGETIELRHFLEATRTVGQGADSC